MLQAPALGRGTWWRVHSSLVSSLIRIATDHMQDITEVDSADYLLQLMSCAAPFRAVPDLLQAPALGRGTRGRVHTCKATRTPPPDTCGRCVLLLGLMCAHCSRSSPCVVHGAIPSAPLPSYWASSPAWCICFVAHSAVGSLIWLGVCEIRVCSRACPTSKLFRHARAIEGLKRTD